MPIEVWKQSPSLPEYQVSSWGRVMRAPYDAPMPYGGKRRYGGKPHFGQFVEEERRCVFYFRGRTYKVHQPVCEAFHGPKPFPRAVVMHGDEIGCNNRADNLAWGTQKQNLNAPGFLAYCRSRTGDDSPTAKSKKMPEAA